MRYFGTPDISQILHSNIKIRLLRINPWSIVNSLTSASRSSVHLFPPANKCHEKLTNWLFSGWLFNTWKPFVAALTPTLRATTSPPCWRTRQSCNEDSSKIWEECSANRLLYIIDCEPVSIVHYTRPGTCINRQLHKAWIKRPTPNYLAAQCHVNWPALYPESSFKIMDPVYQRPSPKIFKRIFVATLGQGAEAVDHPQQWRVHVRGGHSSWQNIVCVRVSQRDPQLY